MNILITGVHGFVGSNLTTALMKNHTIFGLDIVFPPKEGLVKTYSWSQKNEIPQIDVIIHLAGKAHDTKNTTDEKAYYDVNVGLTKQIFDYFIKSNATKFIYFSSVKAVADSVKGDKLFEDAIPNPQTPYGKSKLQAEQYIQEQALSLGKKFYILRPCMIHGAGNKGNLNLLYKLAQKGLPWPLGAFENKRSFLSVNNLAFAIKQLIEKDIESGVYQLADDEPVSTNELIGLMANSLDRKARIWNLSSSFIKSLVKIGDIFRLPLNNERLKKLTESYVVSNEKIKKAFGINKMPVSAKDGLASTLKSFKN